MQPATALTIRSEITLREYTKLLLSLVYRKPVMILILCAGAAMLAWIAGHALGVAFLPEPGVFQSITLVLIAVVQPLMVIRTIRRTYRSSSYLQEPLSIVFDRSKIRMTGVSFYMELIWSETHKVVELDDWFMIYQNTISAIIAPKRSFAPGKADEFKRMLRFMPGLNLHLLR